MEVIRFKSKAGMKEVIAPPERRNEVLRAIEALTLNQSGSTRWNMGATQVADAVAEQAGLPVDRYAFLFSVDPDEKLIAATPVPFGTPGSVNVKRDQRAGFIRTSFVSIYREFPSMRLSGSHFCAVGAGVDHKGRPSVLVPLQNVIPRQKGQRLGRALTPAPAPQSTIAQLVQQAAAAKQSEE